MTREPSIHTDRRIIGGQPIPQLFTLADGITYRIEPRDLEEGVLYRLQLDPEHATGRIIRDPYQEDA